ncbi:MAG TPA: hypothetical protein VJT73_05820 [Polyangiaceae bacterium]|nr:hypothetical protein [Polyangiaceae bacterium]
MSQDDEIQTISAEAPAGKMRTVSTLRGVPAAQPLATEYLRRAKTAEGSWGLN